MTSSIDEGLLGVSEVERRAQGDRVWDEAKYGRCPAHLRGQVKITQGAPSFKPEQWAISEELSAAYEKAHADFGPRWLKIVDDERLSTLAKNEDRQALAAECVAALDAADKRAAERLEKLRQEVASWAGVTGARPVDVADVLTATTGHVTLALGVGQDRAGPAVWALWRRAAERRDRAEVRAWAELVPTLLRHAHLDEPIMGETSNLGVNSAIASEVAELTRVLATPGERLAAVAQAHLDLQEVRVQARQAFRPGPLDIFSAAERARAYAQAQA